MQARPQGFTLIELMVALAIAALLLLLGMPSFTTFVRNSEIRSTSESIINGLRAATAEAANRNQKVTFELASATGADWKFWVLRRRRRHEEDDPGILEEGSGAEHEDHGHPRRQADGHVQRTRPGRHRPGEPDNHIRQIDIDSVVAGEARPLRIIVDDPNPPAAGKPRGLRMCDPDPALAALVASRSQSLLR